MNCPICADAVSDGAMSSGHWYRHMDTRPDGRFTWSCACGPSGMSWEHRVHAETALAFHMVDHHGFRQS